MTDRIAEHARRFDEKAATYDEGETPEHRACVDLVIAHAEVRPDDVVLDLGTGTGEIALALADDAGRVLGRDISEGMLEQARRKAGDADLDNVEFGEGRFRAPDVDAADVIVSNFAMHHLDDDAKREAIAGFAALGARRVVLGDIMLFEHAEEPASFYDPAVDDPATVGTLVEAFTDAGFVVTDVERVHDQAGVIVADRPT